MTVPIIDIRYYKGDEYDAMIRNAIDSLDGLDGLDDDAVEHTYADFFRDIILNDYDYNCTDNTLENILMDGNENSGESPTTTVDASGFVADRNINVDQQQQGIDAVDSLIQP